MKVNLIYPEDRWILNKIATELLKSKDIEFGPGINYYINWVYWKHFNGCQKSDLDVVFFTHFDELGDKKILDYADYIFCMSAHGKRELMLEGIPESKIKVIGGFGISVEPRKIRLGIAGRPYSTGRKGQDILLKLHAELDKNIFEFVFARDWKIDIGRVSDNFFADIDYLLITSNAEGGPMDSLNAYALNIPVISMDIGFVNTLKDEDDIIYENYEVLIHKLKQLEDKVSHRKKLLSAHTWDNFRNWHRGAFEELGIN